MYKNNGEVSGFRVISKETGIKWSILSRITDRLESHGLLTREIKGFPRKGTYKLTEKGMEVAELAYKLLDLLGDL